MPAGRFIDDLRRYLGTCPASLLSQPEALDLKQWFEALLRPSDRAVRDNKVKNAVGYIASGVAIAADYLITGGTVSATVAWVSGLFFSTTAALDVANSKLSSRVDEARDIFDAWLNEKRE